MNQKKAKMLRGLAGGSIHSKYRVNEPTRRDRFKEVVLGLDSKGKEIVKRVDWQTRSLVLEPSARKVYKVLKNMYGNRSRDLSSNIRQVGFTSSSA